MNVRERNLSDVCDLRSKNHETRFSALITSFSQRTTHALANELIRSAPPVNGRQQTFASAEGASGENLAVFRLNNQNYTRFLALITLFSQGMPTARSYERVDFVRKWQAFASALGTSGEVLSDLRSKNHENTIYPALITSFSRVC